MTLEEIEEIRKRWREIYSTLDGQVFVGKEYVFKLLSALEASQREAAELREMRQRLLDVEQLILAAPNMEINRDNLLAMIKSLTVAAEK